MLIVNIIAYLKHSKLHIQYAVMPISGGMK